MENRNKITINLKSSNNHNNNTIDVFIIGPDYSFNLDMSDRIGPGGFRCIFTPKRGLKYYGLQIN
jgi:hypothetical protein